MSTIAIATIYNGKQLAGFRLFGTESNQFKDVPYANIVAVVNSGKAHIDNLEVQENKLVGSNGAIERLPRLVNGILVGNSPLIVLNQIGDQGYTVVDFKGKVLKLRNEDVVKYAKTQGIANGKVVSKNGTEYISSINGEYNKIVTETNNVNTNTKQKNESHKETNVDNDNIKSINTEVNQEKLADEIVREEKEREEKEKDRERKIQEMQEAIRKRAEEIEPQSQISKTLKSANGMTVEQRIARSLLLMKMLHPFYYAVYALLKKVEDPRVPTMGVNPTEMRYNPNFVAKLTEGELNFINLHEVLHIAMLHSTRLKDRNHMIFNIACDLYINKLLCEEFGLTPGASKIINNVEIQCPKEGCFDKDIDTKTETPEIIYDRIMQDAQNNKSNPQSGDEGDSDDSGGDTGGSGEGSASGDSNSSNSEEVNGSSPTKSAQSNKKKSTTVIYKGKQHTLTEDQKDLIKSNKAPEEQQMDEACAKQLIEQALLKSYGTTSGNIERIIKEMLAPKIDWKKIFRNMLIELTKVENSLSRPDKRFMNRGLTLPGPTKQDIDKLKGIKVCIDTSGSIGDDDLGIVYTQIRALLQSYKVEAEVIYWDTKVQNTAEFKNIKQFEKIKAKGGGGTDANCIFEYFKSNQCKYKPQITLVFTDGCFGRVDKSYSLKNKNTIWIISDGNDKSFEAPFGKVAPFKSQ